MKYIAIIFLLFTSCKNYRGRLDKPKRPPSPHEYSNYPDSIKERKLPKDTSIVIDYIEELKRSYEGKSEGW